MGLFDLLKGFTGGSSKGKGSMLDSVIDLVGSGNNGLGGLVDKFAKKGLGDIVESWIGKGDNKAISVEQLTKVLGKGKIKEIAKSTGMKTGETASKLSEILPQVIDKLTPAGKVDKDDDKGFDFSVITDLFK